MIDKDMPRFIPPYCSKCIHNRVCELIPILRDAQRECHENIKVHSGNGVALYKQERIICTCKQMEAENDEEY